MGISLETIRKTAFLSHLELTDQEVKMYGEQLSQVLGYVSKLSEVNTEGVEPMVTPSPMEFTFREDKPVAGNKTQELLENAPERAGNLFKVPPVL